MSDDRRYYGLDALRGGMMLLGIIPHSGTLYLPAPPPHLPLTTDPNNSLAMDAIFDFIHSSGCRCSSCSPFSLPVFALYTAATLWPYPGGQVDGGRGALPAMVCGRGGGAGLTSDA